MSAKAIGIYYSLLTKNTSLIVTEVTGERKKYASIRLHRTPARDSIRSTQQSRLFIALTSFW
jgi:hypothetical protein